MTHVTLGLGLVLVIEGLVLALAPRYLDQALARLSAMVPDTRRRVGLAMVAGGAALLMLWRYMGEA